MKLNTSTALALALGICVGLVCDRTLARPKIPKPRPDVASAQKAIAPRPPRTTPSPLPVPPFVPSPEFGHVTLDKLDAAIRLAMTPGSYKDRDESLAQTGRVN